MNARAFCSPLLPRPRKARENGRRDAAASRPVLATLALAAVALGACNTSDGRSGSPSVVYEYERFGSPEIRTPQLEPR